MKPVLAGILLLLCSFSTIQAQVNTVIPSIVSVLPDWPAGEGNLLEPEGSGIVVADGRKILTAAHVLKNATAVRVRTNAGDIISARIIWKDLQTDIALLAIAKTLPSVKLFASPKIGSRVCAIGNSFGLGVSVSCGVLSAKQKTNAGFNPIEDFLQTDAAVNPGKSGGALVDDQGQVVGMLSAIFTKKSDANIGINFAVSSRLLKSLMAITTQSNVPNWRKNPLQLKAVPTRGKTGKQGAQIVKIKVGSQVEIAGLKAADIIIQSGKRRIKYPSDFITEFAIHAHENMAITIIRNNTEMHINWHFKKY